MAGGRYRGQWTPHYGKFPSREELAVLEGDFFGCICNGQVDNVMFKDGDYLIAVRDDHGVTMTDLAHRFGVSAKTLSRLMNERKAAKATVPG